MRKKILGLLTMITILVTSCNNVDQKHKNEGTNANDADVEKELTEVELFVESIETAHQKDSFNNKGAVQFDLMLSFGGKTRFDGKITMTPNGDRIRMQDSMATMVWNGKKAMIAPDTANEEGARFALFTWSYFFAAAYKLSDPGTSHEFLGKQPLNEKNYTASRLTFGENVGDSPEDWYIVYREDSSKLMAAMAYIVTAGGTSQEEAEQDPHAITYEAYTNVEGIPFATVWNFWTWNKEGKMEKLLGNASISNIQFVEVKEELFTVAGQDLPI